MTNQNEWQTFFDGYASQYEDEVFTKDTAREIQFLLEELNLPAGSAILDIGCGTGRHSVALAKLGYRMTGVDISAGMLAQAREAARQAGVSLELVHANAKDFQADQAFDAAICLCEGALCLLGSADDPYERDEIVLRNIYAALKPGALFLTTVLNACRMIRKMTDDDVRSGYFDPVTMIETSQMDVNTPKGTQKVTVRERTFTPAEFVRMMKHAGFVVDHVYGGTAGDWRREPMKLDEMEMMVIAHKPKK